MEFSSEHVVGTKIGDGQKQLLIAIGGIHGNELAGLKAIERVLTILSSTKNGFYGTFVGLAGNLLAIRQGKRFIKHDLNRIWTESDFEIATHAQDAIDYPDHSQLKTLKRTIEFYLNQNFEDVAIIDLHTTSANGGVFIGCPNDEIHKKMIQRLHVPVILNLAKDLKGTAMQYFWNKGIVSFAFEGGNHYSPESIDKMESALWLCLEYMGCIDRREFDNVEYHDLRLIHSTENLPHFCNVVYHHQIHEGDNFEMKPGFLNFQKIEAGTVLANDRNGPIYSPENSYILMPLYQKQGADGFFLIRSVK